MCFYIVPQRAANFWLRNAHGSAYIVHHRKSKVRAKNKMIESAGNSGTYGWAKSGFAATDDEVGALKS